MDEAIVVALITGLCVAVPNIIVATINNKSNKNLFEYKISELTRQVEKHNQVIERVYRLEENTAVQNEQIKEINDKIEDLKK